MRRISADRVTRTCKLDLPREEQQLLETLAGELRRAVLAIEEDSAPPGSLRRLYPRAYVHDEEAERAYSESTRGEMTSSRLRALDTMVQTARARALTEDQMHDWMSAITDMRLVIGTILEVTDTGEYGAADLAPTSETVVYEYLSMLVSDLVDIMEQWLPDPLPGSDDNVPDDPWGEPLGGLRWDGTEQPSWPPRPEW